METQCPFCGKSHSVAEDLFRERDKADLTCPSCGKSFPVVNPKLQALRADTTHKSVGTVVTEYSSDGRVLALPKDKILSLKVLEGGEKGTIFAVAKPRITIGRTNSDILIEDSLASRVHCSLEVMEDWILLRDLDSTNGTFVDDERIKTSTLVNGATFRVGSHVFKLLISPK